MDVRNQLQRYLSLLDQSHFDLAFPKFALNNPITVFLDENWVNQKLTFGKLLFRSRDLKTELALCDGGPRHDEGIKSFLTAFVRIPFVNVVPVDFSAHCLSTVDYLTQFTSHRLPGQRRLSLSLYHVRPDLLLTTNIDAEMDCFPLPDEAKVVSFRDWCRSCSLAVIQRLRKTRQLTLVEANLWIRGRSCCNEETHFSFKNLGILRAALAFLSPENIYEGSQFPILQLTVLSSCYLCPYEAKTRHYESYFPGVEVHFGFLKRCADDGPSDYAASCLQNTGDMTLAFEYPSDEPVPSGVRFMSSTEFYIRVDRVVPLSLEKVDLTLSSLDILAELLIGCLKTREALRQIKSLRGQLANVSKFGVTGGKDLDAKLVNEPTVRTADLRPFLEMFPFLQCLEIRVDIWFLKANFALFHRRGHIGRKAHEDCVCENALSTLACADLSGRKLDLQSVVGRPNGSNRVSEYPVMKGSLPNVSSTMWEILE
ncbi:unnamed protein product [Dibothriocephalus latus]|uniref:Uncharacterized protein n=1 Tax=Dibothriocephalus latus TaxID=60516 RepID=A0A3P7PX98_DIBLA|nr:unnamed protein product [Dibothriocephalus latus]